MHHGPRAIAVVQRAFVPREDIDDHRLAGPQLAVAQVVAIGPDRPAGNDRGRVHVAQIDEPVIDHGPDPFGGQRAAFVEEHAVASRLGPGDQAASPLDDLLGGLLRLADMLDFLGVLAAAVGDADAPCRTRRRCPPRGPDRRRSTAACDRPPPASRPRGGGIRPPLGPWPSRGRRTVRWPA